MHDYWKPIEGTFSCESITQEQLAKLFQPTDTWRLVCNLGKIQKRTHKKRRINKKWAKRYGFKDVVLTGDVIQAEGNESYTINSPKICITEEDNT